MTMNTYLVMKKTMERKKYFQHRYTHIFYFQLNQAETKLAQTKTGNKSTLAYAQSNRSWNKKKVWS